MYADPDYSASDLMPSTFCVDRSERGCKESVVLALTLVDCGAVMVEVDMTGGNAHDAREVAQAMVEALKGPPSAGCIG